MPKTYNVSQSEDLLEIAFSLGFGSTEKFHALEENRALLALRSDGVLNPGDELAIPERKPITKRVSTNQSHRFVLKIPRRPLSVRVLDEDGEPVANADFVLEGSGVSESGTTDGDGIAMAEIPAGDCKNLKLTVLGQEIRLSVAALDPVTSVSGLQGRLSNLGYPVGSRDGSFGPATRRAIKHFQSDHDLPCTGVVDDATRKRLVEAHGS